MQVGKKGIELIKEFEGLRFKSYLCPAGVWTIGWGHTRTAKEGQVITIEQAEKLLIADLRDFESTVNAFVKVDLTQNQFDALVSFAFNVGSGAFRGSTLLKKLNSGDYQGASEEFPRWNKADGRVSIGLQKRREKERQLFLLKDDKAMIKFIQATTDTVLKKEPLQSPLLTNSQKVDVKTGRRYDIDDVLDQEGLHTKIRLKHGAGDWWVFNPHWDMRSLSQDKTLKAIFTIRPVRANFLITGDLEFYLGDSLDISFKATSGAIGFQYREAESIRGKGLIPEGKDWKINPNGWWSNTRGIEGMFYHITPDPYIEGSITRAELGLHRDANVPGSAGCIVILDSDDFNRRLVTYMSKHIRDYSNKLISLEVKYLP